MNLQAFFENRRKKRLYRAELALADSVHEYKKWGFGNTPSEDVRDRRRIKKQIAKIYKLGGKPEKVLDGRFTSLILELADELITGEVNEMV